MRKQEPQYIINVRLPIPTAEKLDEIAYRERSTRTEEIRKAVTEYVERKAVTDGAAG